MNSEQKVRIENEFSALFSLWVLLWETQFNYPGQSNPLIDSIDEQFYRLNNAVENSPEHTDSAPHVDSDSVAGLWRALGFAIDGVKLAAKVGVSSEIVLNGAHVVLGRLKKHIRFCKGAGKK